MNRVYLNGRFLTQRITGVQRFAIECVNALDKLLCTDPGAGAVDVQLLVPRGVVAPLALKQIEIKQVGRLTGQMWEQIELPFYARNGLLLNFCNLGPLMHRHQIVTMHDATIYVVPQAHGWLFSAWYRFMFPRLGRIANAVITVSENSKRDLERYCGLGAGKAFVVGEGAEHILRVQPDYRIFEQRGIGGRPYVLAVSSLSPNKNFSSVVRSFEYLKDLNCDVVIAGGTSPKIFSASEALPESIKYVGYVTDAELRALYERALVFVYPSLCEGFGLPPLEAMHCGCPTIVSRRASLPEVCGDAAIYFDPEDPSDIARAIKLVVGDETLRRELRSKGLARAQGFSWDKTARQVWNVVETQYAGGRNGTR